jgi:CheY-like chemotaxis protein
VFTFSARFGLGEAQPARTPSALAGLHVLIIDDSESQRRIFKRALQRAGVGVDAFGKAEAGLEALLQDRKQRYDALLVDVRGPDTDDFALVERIRAVPALKTMRIMVLATLGMRGDTAYCRKLGISAYLVKPTSPYEVLEALQRVMEQPLEVGVEAPVVTRHNLHEGLGQETALPQPEPEDPPGDAPVTGLAESDKPLNILLAEDNPVNQKLACTILQRKGHHVVVAENGRIALETFRRLPFDLVLMDVQMPIMGGLEATQEIRALEAARAVARPVVIAAMTANAFAGDRIACLEAGMDDYLSKPMRMAELERVLGGVAMGSYRA